MNVLNMKKKCPRCRASLTRVDGKWWCMFCQMFVKPRK